tara:strand:+ start:2390 stop:2734 length:345 start_codon:yes stop_codon:yes gene_type:complete
MIKGVEGRVKNVLEKFEQTRDDDMKLFAYIIIDFFNFNKSYIESLTANDVIGKIHNGSIPHFTSVLRCRQKLQEKIPELRGDLYDKRKKHAEKVKEEIKNFEPETGQKNLFGGI